MRTTVTLDSDVERALRERMEREGIPFKRALNDAIRAGVHDDTPRYETPSFDLGERSVDLTKANQIAGDLEDATIIASRESAAG